MLQRSLALFLGVTLLASLAAVGPVPRAAAGPVADTEELYQLYGRVFPDPHGCVRGLPAKSPYAKGSVCATTFIQFPEMVSGLRFLDSKFPELMEIYDVGESTGVPTPTLERLRSDLYAVRVTDERGRGPSRPGWGRRTRSPTGAARRRR